MTEPQLVDMTVDVIMDRWPETIRVFLDHRMSCVGCPVGGFHTLGDAAHEYRLTLEVIERDMLRAIRREP